MPSWPDTARSALRLRVPRFAAAMAVMLSVLSAVVLLGACGSSGAEHGQPRDTEAPRTLRPETRSDTGPDTRSDTTPETGPESRQSAASPAAPGRSQQPAAAAAAAAPPEATDTPGGALAATPAGAAAPGAGPTCTRQAFASPLPLAEASGATYLAHPETPVLLLVGDSGTRGAFLELDPATGAVLASGRLPLGRGASDDLEGLTAIGDTIYGITSAGWMRHWRRHPGRPAARRYELVRGPYPIARPGRDDAGLVCASARDVNCGRNYEGLCLHDPPDAGKNPAAACAGFAVSKTDGALYCLTFEPGGAVRAHAEDPIAVAPAETLTGCDFAPPGSDRAADLLWVGSNAFGANRVFTVSGWQAPASARVALVGVLGVGFGEAMALGPDGAVYRFSDTASARSLADKYHCE
jgi:hypothetical protein